MGQLDDSVDLDSYGFDRSYSPEEPTTDNSRNIWHEIKGNIPQLLNEFRSDHFPHNLISF